MRKLVYKFCTEWVEEQGQLYSDAHYFEASSEARKAHAGAKQFLWAGGKARPSVTDLYAMTVDTDESGKGRLVSTDIIADGDCEGPSVQEAVPF